MEILSSFSMALEALRANKLRSGLTMLGIIIGVGAVIAMMAVGLGAQTEVEKQIASIGSNLILILPGSVTSGGLRAGMGSVFTLTMDDYKAISRECPSVKAAAPSLRGTAQIVYSNQNWSTIVYGSTPEVQEIRDWKLTSGRFFYQSEVDSSAKVCVMGKTVIDNLFGGQDPLGQIVRIKKIPFTVVGTLAPKGQSPQGQDQDDAIFIPVTTAQTKVIGTLFRGTVGAIMVQALASGYLKSAQSEVTQLLRQRHRLQPGQDNDFDVRNLTELLAATQRAAQTMSLLLGAIASVSLLVGGIGIMNIMLVSVTERTREIGLRKAIGARSKDIMQQFVIEAVSLSMVGGIMGIAVGVIISVVIGRFANWDVLISPVSIFLAFGFSAAVGIFFGYYPARMASRLNPIEALRWE